MFAAHYDKPACYGGMFPDLNRLHVNKPCAGKVFSSLAKSEGIGVQSLNVLVDQEQWAKCEACWCYRSCYDLSMGKLVLHYVMSKLI